MNKKLFLVNLAILFLGVFLYSIMTFIYDINQGSGYRELENIVLLAIPCFLIFVYSFMVESEIERKRLLIIYLICYAVLLSGFVFSSNRINVLVEKNIMFREYNLIPFHSIITLFQSNLSKTFGIYNIIGNFLMLTPLSILLPILFDKQTKWKSFLLTIIIIVILIETTQYISGLGSLDIDDFILNISGSLFIYFIIQTTNLRKFFKNLFLKKVVQKRLCLIIYTLLVITFFFCFTKRLMLVYQHYIDNKIDLYNISCKSEERVYLGNVRNYSYYSNCNYGDSYIKVGNQKYRIDEFIKSTYVTDRLLTKLNIDREQIITNVILSGESKNTKIRLYMDNSSSIYLYGFQDFFIEKNGVIYDVKKELQENKLDISFIHNLVELSLLDNINGYSIETGKYYSILTCGDNYSVHNDFYILDSQYVISKDSCNQLSKKSITGSLY